MFERAGNLIRNVGSLLLEAFRQWQRDNALELGAALSYYAVFTLAPVLVIVIAVAGLAFGREAAQGEIFAQFRGLIGGDGAHVLQTAVESASRPTSGIVASAVGFLALILGASGAFGQLQSSLNRIWNLPPSPQVGWRLMMRQRLLSFAMVIGIGFLLLVSLIVSAGLAALGRWMEQWLPGIPILRYANEFLSFIVVTLLFALMYHVLPDIRIAWRDVWIGSAITSFLFLVGKAGIGLYVTLTRLGSAYGIAGSIVVLLAWIYYSSQIIFFGAECTQVYAERYGSRRPMGPASLTAPAPDAATPAPRP